MLGYLLDTNAASALWDARDEDHQKIKGFLESIGDSPIFISVVVISEVEYGLKRQSKLKELTKKNIREEMSKFSEILSINKHTSDPYSNLRARLFDRYLGSNKKWPEDLIDRTTAKELGVQENDIWIASQALQYNLILVSSDRMNCINEISKKLTIELQIIDWRKEANR